jgi:hypothetical protein
VPPQTTPHPPQFIASVIVSAHIVVGQQPLSHWLFVAQGVPPTCLGAQIPPFDVSQKEPAAQSVSAEHATQVPLAHTPLWQSRANAHALVLAHGLQSTPPQSTSVSSPSFTPFMQCWGTHEPCPSQTTPPLSLHVVSLGLFWVPQARGWEPQIATLHAVVGVGQSAGEMQATQAPLTQALPPLSVHAVPKGTSVSVQQPAEHVGTLQAVAAFGQSASPLHAMPPSHMGALPPPVDVMAELPAPPVPAARGPEHAATIVNPAARRGKSSKRFKARILGLAPSVPLFSYRIMPSDVRARCSRRARESFPRRSPRRRAAR